MLFRKFFRSSFTLLEARLILSESSCLQINNKTKEIGDKELILLALLIYGRYLRVESSKEEKINLINFFDEYHVNFKASNYEIDFSEKMNHLITLISKQDRYKASINIKLKKVEEGNWYIDMGIIKVIPLSTAVYTTFISIWECLEKKETRTRLLEGFVTLGKIYIKEGLTIRSAVDFPNIIVYETLPFDEPTP